jgi:hypothetical protein
MGVDNLLQVCTAKSTWKALGSRELPNIFLIYHLASFINQFVVLPTSECTFYRTFQFILSMMDVSLELSLQQSEMVSFLNFHDDDSTPFFLRVLCCERVVNMRRNIIQASGIKLMGAFP